MDVGHTSAEELSRWITHRFVEKIGRQALVSYSNQIVDNKLMF
jgi:hypothetical protein